MNGDVLQTIPARWVMPAWTSQTLREVATDAGLDPESITRAAAMLNDEVSSIFTVGDHGEMVLVGVVEIIECPVDVEHPFGLAGIVRPVMPKGIPDAGNVLGSVATLLQIPQAQGMSTDRLELTPDLMGLLRLEEPLEGHALTLIDDLCQRAGVAPPEAWPGTLTLTGGPLLSLDCWLLPLLVDLGVEPAWEDGVPVLRLQGLALGQWDALKHDYTFRFRVELPDLAGYRTPSLLVSHLGLLRSWQPMEAAPGMKAPAEDGAIARSLKWVAQEQLPAHGIRMIRSSNEWPGLTGEGSIILGPPVPVQFPLRRNTGRIRSWLAGKLQGLVNWLDRSEYHDFNLTGWSVRMGEKEDDDA